jgi:hypothetical protein
MRNGRALIARDISNSAFEQSLGDGENALAVKYRARWDTQLLDLFGKRTFGHA